jgi:tripartite-type tricarboxylate transporter receptor subunit TctC
MSMSVALPQVRAGNAKALVVTARERWPDLPDVPTLIDAGISQAVAETWQGFMAPAGTPPDIVDRIAKETIAILSRPEIKEKFRQVGFGVVAQGPDGLRTRIAEELVKWKDVLDQARIKIQ